MIVRNVIFILLCSLLGFSQEKEDLTLSFGEYIGYVKEFHPIVKQADLKLEEGQANLLKSRGAFDPKLEVNYDTKNFENKDYFDIFNATFKVPTWYGIELKANFEENSGLFLNPQNNLPENGLFTAGVSVALGQGLLINERMATLKKAKFYREQTSADRELMANAVIYDAAIAYFNWLQAQQEMQMYNRFLENAKTRFNGVKKSVIEGDKAAIDSLEANINVNNRLLASEQAKVKVIKNRLNVSNYLWLDNTVPLELNEAVSPIQVSRNEIDNTLELDKAIGFNIKAHPKIKSLDNKISSLNVDKKLKANKLLPKVDIQYNLLSQEPDINNIYNSSNYKAGVNFSFPLFLRKERGDLKLAKLKIEASGFEMNNIRLSISNKIEALQREIESYDIQNNVIDKVVIDYETLLAAEERKFSFGESSVFLINYRESSLIDAQLKQLELKNKYYKTKAKLFNSLGFTIE